MLVVPTWQFLHKRQIPSLYETSLLELSAYYLRAWLSPSPANGKLDSKLPSTQLLHAHTSRAALGLLHLPALPTISERSNCALIGLWPTVRCKLKQVFKRRIALSHQRNPPLVLSEPPEGSLAGGQGILL